MPAVSMTGLNGTPVSIDQSAVDKFAAGLRGQLLRPEDPACDAARRIWNAMIDRRPALILCCQGVADVVTGVNFAREQGIIDRKSVV